MDTAVQACFEEILCHKPNEAQLAFWTERLENGLSLNDLAQALLAQQAEARSASHLFQTLFGVSDDSTGSGLSYWNDSFRQLRADHPELGYKGVLLLCIQDWLNSDAFKTIHGPNSNAEYLSVLYIDILGRMPDPEGFDHWLAKLDGGVLTREQLLVEFTKSVEFRSEVDADDPLRTATKLDDDPQSFNNRGLAMSGATFGGTALSPVSKGAGHLGTDMATAVGDISVLPSVLSVPLLSAATPSASAASPTGDSEIFQAHHHAGVVLATPDQDPIGSDGSILANITLFRDDAPSNLGSVAKGDLGRAPIAGNAQNARATGTPPDQKMALSRPIATDPKPVTADGPQSGLLAEIGQQSNAEGIAPDHLTTTPVQADAVVGTSDEVAPNVVLISRFPDDLPLLFDGGLVDETPFDNGGAAPGEGQEAEPAAIGEGFDADVSAIGNDTTNLVDFGDAVTANIMVQADAPVLAWVPSEDDVVSAGPAEEAWGGYLELQNEARNYLDALFAANSVNAGANIRQLAGVKMRQVTS